MKKFIPNALTLLNLLSGGIAVVFVTNNDFTLASLFVFLGIFFDFFDGFAARKLNVQSELGLQLDSLADMVTSGLVPGLTMFKLFEMCDLNSKTALFLPFFGLFITLASAYRLAKFNLDEEQKNYFKGLPTPANALLIVSLPLIIQFHNNDAINSIIVNEWFLIILTIGSCYLLNSDIKLFALKFKTYTFKGNSTRYIFIILSLILLITMWFLALPLIILIYVSMSVIDNYVKTTLK